VQEPKLMDRMRHAIRLRHYRLATERAYVHWVRRFILFHGKRHPIAMGKEEVEQFLTHLAVNRGVSHSAVVHRGAVGTRSPFDRLQAGQGSHL